MLPNPFGNPAVKLFNDTVCESIDSFSKPMNTTSKQPYSHKDCKTNQDDIDSVCETLIAEHKTTKTEVKIPTEEWENMQRIVQSLVDDHKMLNSENEEYRKALSMYRS